VHPTQRINKKKLATNRQTKPHVATPQQCLFTAYGVIGFNEHVHPPFFAKWLLVVPYWAIW